jgi:ABC-2 type transport system ATP-binding protein
MSETLIELKSVTKLYGTVIGVNDFTAELKPGAYGLVGPNGAGKSTLLNLLTGQLLPTRGTVTVFGENPRNNSNLLSKTGFCPGYEGLYATTSGLDWVTLLLQLHGPGYQEARSRAAECLELVGMSEGMHRPISTYSRGMRQRTKLAQAMAHNPSLMILDEPFSGLDPIGRAEMTAVLRDYVQLGKSILIASHVLHEIEALTDNFLLICGGRLLASGTAAEVNQLLFETPSEVELVCDRPQLLGGVLLQKELVRSASVIARDGTDHLVLQTLNTGTLGTELPGIIAEHEINVSRMTSVDDSLQSLFNSLMRIHRGEQ